MTSLEQGGKRKGEKGYHKDNCIIAVSLSSGTVKQRRFLYIVRSETWGKKNAKRSPYTPHNVITVGIRFATTAFAKTAKEVLEVYVVPMV